MSFSKAWENITSDSWILNTIKYGYKIEFESEPVQTFIANALHFSDKENSLIDKEIDELLNKGVIVSSENEKDQFISNLFLVRKNNGKFRPVLNLKNLNRFVKYCNLFLLLQKEIALYKHRSFVMHIFLWV